MPTPDNWYYQAQSDVVDHKSRCREISSDRGVVETRKHRLRALGGCSARDLGWLQDVRRNTDTVPRKGWTQIDPVLV
jgi:hypothetical protein